MQLKELPVIIKEVDDEDSLELSLIENIQRQDLNAIEEARAFQYLMDKFQISQDRVSEMLGKSRSTVANTLRLLKLPQEIQEAVRQGKISYAHGRALVEVEDAHYQRKLAQEVISKGLSVRELENLLKKRRGLRQIRQQVRARAPQDTYLAVLEEELQQILATKVRIIKNKKRGTITIEFYSREDLQRITETIRGGHTDR